MRYAGGRIMKKLRTLLLSTILAVLLCACGSDTNVDTNTVIVDKKGAVTEAIIEDFSQPYYDADELKSEIESKVAAYNTEAGTEDAVSLDKFELSEDKVVSVKLKFSSSNDYTSFNEKELFAGTVADAYAAGYSFPSMQDVKQEGVTLSSEDVLEKGSMNIVILEEAQQVIVPSDICYISDGVSVVSDKTAVNLNDGELAYIIYE
jgi:hypothetical protein